jgi:hypothetical protein
MAAYVKYTAGVEPLLENINSGSDTWKLALSNTFTVGDTTFTPGTTDLATASGYTAGGVTLTTSSATQSGGVYKLVLATPGSPTWTFSGAVTFRYVILWDSTTSTPVGSWDYGSSITTVSGDTFTATLDGTNGVFQVT